MYNYPLEFVRMNKVCKVEGGATSRWVQEECEGGSGWQVNLLSFEKNEVILGEAFQINPYPPSSPSHMVCHTQKLPAQDLPGFA